MRDVIISALITEKSMKAVPMGKFTFKVRKDSNKKEIRDVIQKKFSVDVVSVSTSIMKGKTKKTRTRTRMDETPISHWKKAIVALKEGQKISLFEAGGEK